MTKKEITICGKQVEIFYCAATENGYERMTGKQISVFLPTFKQDENGETVIDQLPEATNEDYLCLALAGIVAADTYYDRDTTITSKEILFEAKPAERNELVKTIIELRSEWYEIPKIVEEIVKKENEKAKADANDGGEEPAKN